MPSDFSPPTPPPPPPSRRAGSFLLFLMRVAVLAGIVAFTARLVALNRKHDPRFYSFLETVPGRWMAEHVLQKSALARTATADDPLKAEELPVRDRLRQELAQAWPTHRVVLWDGRQMPGHVVERTERELVFEERAARAGSIQVRWPLSRVRQVEELTGAPPPVLNRDVRFHLQFPALHYFRSPPFTLLTDQSVFDAEDSVRELRRLHAELAAVFAPLVTATNMNDGIQLLFFSEEDAYREHCRTFAPNLENSAGFFSPSTGRLALFNQRSSEEIASAHRDLARQAESVGRQRLSPGQRVELASQVRAIRSRINEAADLASLDTLRHEGAHQWLHLSGVHSRHFAENTWLVEGLAMWCETDPVGASSRRMCADVDERIREDSSLDWEALIAHRSPGGFFAFQDPERVSEAYARSWIMVHWLMDPVRREAFFAYLRHVRDRGNVDEVATRPPLELLGGFLGLSPDRLTDSLEAHRRAMAAR